MARDPPQNDSGKSCEESEEIPARIGRDLDDLTHQELRLMYDRASEAVLFARIFSGVRGVAGLMAAFITLATHGRPCEYSGRVDNHIGRRSDVRSNPLPVLQYNEIYRIVEIEKCFRPCIAGAISNRSR